MRNLLQLNDTHFRLILLYFTVMQCRHVCPERESHTLRQIYITGSVHTETKSEQDCDLDI